MDPDDALPPAIRRSPRAALEAQKTRDYRQFVFDDSDEDPDEAAPPPIARSRSTSIDGELFREARSRAASFSDLNPLRAHPVDAIPPKNPARQFSRPFRDPQPQEPRDSPSPDPAPYVEPPQVRRHPRGLISYRNNKGGPSHIKKLPPHLRQQTSLETINSVTTTASEDPSEYGHDPPEAEAPSSDWYTLDDETPGTLTPGGPPPSITSKPSSVHSSSGGSKQSSTLAETPLEYGSLGHHSPQSLFRKMMPRKQDRLEEFTPSRLVIEKSTSIDRTSHRSTLTRSATSPPPQERLELSFSSVQRSRSGSKSSGSSKWSASDFDISTLTEAEIKKCKKKGINPALYAEMRAAKKGKWSSPIAGNTFL